MVLLNTAQAEPRTGLGSLKKKWYSKSKGTEARGVEVFGKGGGCLDAHKPGLPGMGGILALLCFPDLGEQDAASEKR